MRTKGDIINQIQYNLINSEFWYIPPPPPNPSNWSTFNLSTTHPRMIWQKKLCFGIPDQGPPLDTLFEQWTIIPQSSNSGSISSPKPPILDLYPPKTPNQDLLYIVPKNPNLGSIYSPNPQLRIYILQNPNEGSIYPPKRQLRIYVSPKPPNQDLYIPQTPKLGSISSS